MGELGDSVFGDPGLGGEPRCKVLPLVEKSGGENLECMSSFSGGASGVCIVSGGSDCDAQPVLDEIRAAADQVSVENGCQASSEVEVAEGAERPHEYNGASVVREGGHPVIEEAMPIEVPEVAAKEGTNEFPGLSPLRRLGGDSGDAALFDVDRACSGYKDSLLVLSTPVADCPLMPEDRFCCPTLPELCFAASVEGEANKIHEITINLLPMKPMETPMCSLQTSQEQPSAYIEKRKKQREADTCAALEETSTSFQEETEGEKCPSHHLQSEVGGSVKGSPDKLTPYFAEEGSASGQSCHLTTSMESSFLKLSSNADNGTSARCKPSSLLVFRRSNPKRAASSRSSLSDKKPDQITGSRNSGKKSMKAADVRMSILRRISNKVTKKRSYPRRRGNLSVWGTVESLLKIFKKNDDLASSDYDATKIQNKRSKKGRAGKGKNEGQTARKDGRLVVLKCTTSASSNSLPLKDQKSLHPFFRVVASSRSSVRTDVNDCRILPHLPRKNGKVECKLEKNMHGAGIKSLEPDGLHGDKDLESTLTQDTSVENLHGEYPGVSSPPGSEALVEPVNDRQSLDPGTSPDSDVYHPAIDAGIISSACAAATNREAGMDESAPVTEPMAQHELNADVSAYSEVLIPHTSVPPLDSQAHNNHKKGQGKRNGETDGYLCPLSEDLSDEQELSGLKNVNNAAKAEKYSRAEQRKQDSDERIPLFLRSIGEEAGKGSNCNSIQAKSSLLQKTEIECFVDPINVEIGLHNRGESGKNVGNAQLEEGNLAASLPTDRAKVCRLPRGSKTRDKGVSPRYRRQNAQEKKKEKIPKSDYKGKTKKKTITDNACIDTSGEMSSSLRVACKAALTVSASLSSKGSDGNIVPLLSVLSPAVAPVSDGKASERNGLEGQPLKPRAAWVLCDDCQKWRCIPAELADTIDETKCKWTCKDNMDKAFADCSIAQEKTNSEINAELEISDASGDEDCSRAQLNLNAIEPAITTASQTAAWTLIKSNLFLHRNRKTQTIDEVMVCHCKSSSNSSFGCGEECLNRMLNIECVRGTCPCGNLCLNQQFQKRKYAKLKSFKCGKKGYGLQLQEDVTRGQFLIEYVGEVLDFAAYEARQRNYASRGQKHFYFMTLNGGEVIDACIKGNLGRFINHSCDPNCRTEKWMVNGEVCIGLFAIRDIKKGEEVTFDYNYVRVFGAAAKKCVCGSVECRGYIGGDPLSSDAIVQGDSDEEYPEPMMVYGVDGRHLDVSGTTSDAIDSKVVKHEDSHIQQEDLSFQCPPTTIESETCLENEDTVHWLLSEDQPLDNSLQLLDPKRSQDTISRPLPDADVLDNSSQSSISIQAEETVCRPVSDVQPLETVVTTDKSVSVSILCDKKTILKTTEDKKSALKSFPLARSSHSNVKKARPSAKNLAPQKAKKLPIGSASGQYEGVEKKLNDLLDEDGGISKRKDATKGYLKLLFVTAAEGDNVRGFASQSTRDLSLILDALLKTKSRRLLVDIINKNGLQMLHNIMKQNRSNFNRIPIIRKLLKVLEFLALKGILTLEHINKSPPCSGMESFKESILILTRHQDMQVYQIARNFRDKWMPRNIRRVEPSGKGDGQLDSQLPHCNWFQPSSFNCRHDQRTRDTDAVICVSEAVHPSRPSCESDPAGENYLHLRQQASTSLASTDYSSTNGTRIRKRKSRWDNPSDTFSTVPHSLWSNGDQTVEVSPKFMKRSSSQLKQTSQLEVMDMKPGTHGGETSSSDEVASAKDSTEKYIYEDAPPGFGSPRKGHSQAPLIPSIVAFDVDMGCQHQKDDEVPPGFGSSHQDHYPQILSKTFVTNGDVVMAHPQNRYVPHLTVSYGIPVALMQELGTREVEGGSQCHPHWAIAPGMPFHPFPPLPSYPHGNSNPTGSGPSSSARNVMTHQTKEEIQLAKQYHADVDDPRASGQRRAHDEPRTRRHITGRERWPSHGSERRLFQSHRWNNQRFHRAWPSWSREGNNIRSRDSIRNETFGRCIGNPRRHNSDGSSFQEGVSNGVFRSNFHQ